MTVRFPNESSEYRAARNELLDAELALRREVERVAALRRALPPGGRVDEDFSFTGADGAGVNLSELFHIPGASLAVYSFMFGPDQALPCPMCTALLDSLDRAAAYFTRRANLAVVMPGTPDQARAIAEDRGWDHLRLYCDAEGRYSRQYHGMTGEGGLVPMMNVFRRSADGVSHFWGTEMFFAASPWHPRHVDAIWPLWNLFDMLPEGRGDDIPRVFDDP